MAVVTLREVQQWLESTKLRLESLDAELEETARTTVFGQLSSSYDVSTWVDITTTPTLVSKIISMLIASWTYGRQYSEDAQEDNTYATRLEDKANILLTGLLSGAILLPEEDGVEGSRTSTQGPVFWPTDSSTNENGEKTVASFAMGQVF